MTRLLLALALMAAAIILTGLLIVALAPTPPCYVASEACVPVVGA